MQFVRWDPQVLPRLLAPQKRWTLASSLRALNRYPLQRLPICFLFKNQASLITIPTGCVNLGEYVFSGCSSLTTANLPTDLLVVPRNGFQACTSLVSISIPANVTTFGMVLSPLPILTTINIPLGLTKISTYLFWECPLITSFVYAGRFRNGIRLAKSPKGCLRTFQLFIALTAMPSHEKRHVCSRV
jgi:hypothetical protein